MEFELQKANLEIFSETLQELAENDKNILVVTSDSRGSGKLVPFGKRFPEQMIEVGIAEQTLVGVSAGLASTGKKVYAASPASFLTTRSLEQIKNDVCYSDNPVKLVGISAGISYGALGSTHHSLHDIAVLRAIHNISIIIPADNFEAREAVIAAASEPHPVYIRFGKKPMYRLHELGANFEIGRAIQIKSGYDLAFVATGETVIHALRAATELEKDGIRARVISMHTVKPLDTKALLTAAKECKSIITVEEHSIYGGLGEACAIEILESGIPTCFKRVAIPDEYTMSGDQIDVFHHYGISGERLQQTAIHLLDEQQKG